ncbi:2Fe-2S iron-sulfur cluster-binding protein, partial [Planctomycetota bacterium]
MPRVAIDNREVTVPAGATVLLAARQLGIPIPTLCHREGHEPLNSCMVCLIKANDRLLPACATVVRDGMKVESETEEILTLRRGAIELLLSDHRGECLPPCQRACPAGVNLPLLLHHLAAGEPQQAITELKRFVALPATLSRLCAAHCQKACRLNLVDSPVMLCDLARYAADTDVEASEPGTPPLQTDSGKRVAIFGGGPAGLSAAYYLRQAGHGCVLFESRRQPGGVLREAARAGRLPPELLDREISLITRLGLDVRLGATVGQSVPVDELRESFDALLVATGKLSSASGADVAKALKLDLAKRGIRVDPATLTTSSPGVFAAGDAARPSAIVARAMAGGRRAARSIDLYLRGRELVADISPFSLHMGKLDPDELNRLVAAGGGLTDHDRRAAPEAGRMILTETEAKAEARRCIDCGCLEAATCKLRAHAQR